MTDYRTGSTVAVGERGSSIYEWTSNAYGRLTVAVKDLLRQIWKEIVMCTLSWTVESAGTPNHRAPTDGRGPCFFRQSVLTICLSSQMISLHSFPAKINEDVIVLVLFRRWF
jgi:hypothetical protein